MAEEVYADNIAEVAVTGSIIRIDFVSLSATQKDAEGRPVPVHRQRIVMPIEGFAQSLGLIQQVANKLIESGVLVRQEPPKPAEKPAMNGEALSSPNFH